MPGMSFHVTKGPENNHNRTSLSNPTTDNQKSYYRLTDLHALEQLSKLDLCYCNALVIKYLYCWIYLTNKQPLHYQPLGESQITN